MEQREFKDFKHLENKKYPSCELYQIDEGHLFYIEPNFYSQLKYLEGRFYSRYNEIINEIISTVLKNKKVVFTADFEEPVVNEDDFIYQEIEDITNKLNIFVGYVSRGSDYGD